MDTKSPFRFSLRTMLLAVVAVSVGTAAMVSASEWWHTTIMSATFALMVLAILLAIFRSGSSRAFWTGFAVCGSAYLLSLIVQIDNLRLADQLLPGKLLHLAVAKLHAMPSGPYSPMTVTPSYSAPAYGTPTAMPVAVPAYSTSPVNELEPTAPTPLTPGPGENPIPPAEATKPVDSSGCGADEDTPTVEEPTIDVPMTPPPSMPVYIPSATTSYVLPPTTYYSTTPYGYPTTNDIYSRQYRSLLIGHCLWAIVFGVMGGWFSMWLYATKKSHSQAATENTATSPTVNK